MGTITKVCLIIIVILAVVNIVLFFVHRMKKKKLSKWMDHFTEPPKGGNNA